LIVTDSFEINISLEAREINQRKRNSRHKYITNGEAIINLSHDTFLEK
jgi:hypothetical protein